MIRLRFQKTIDVKVRRREEKIRKIEMEKMSNGFEEMMDGHLMHA